MAILTSLAQCKKISSSILLAQGLSSLRLAFSKQLALIELRISKSGITCDPWTRRFSYTPQYTEPIQRCPLRTASIFTCFCAATVCLNIVTVYSWNFYLYCHWLGSDNNFSIFRSLQNEVAWLNRYDTDLVMSLHFNCNVWLLGFYTVILDHIGIVLFVLPMILPKLSLRVDIKDFITGKYFLYVPFPILRVIWSTRRM